MVNPIDAAPDSLQPHLDQPEITAPNDYEATSLAGDAQELAHPDERKRDHEALARSPAKDKTDHEAQQLDMQPVRRPEPDAEAPAKEEPNPPEVVEQHDVTADQYQLAIHRVGARVVGETVDVVEAPRVTNEEQPGDGEEATHTDAETAIVTASHVPGESEGEQETAADAGKPPRTPDDPGPPTGGPNGEEGAEDEGDTPDDGEQEAERAGAEPTQSEIAAARIRATLATYYRQEVDEEIRTLAGREIEDETRDESREAADSSGDPEVAEPAEEKLYNLERVAQVCRISYGGARDVVNRSDSLLYFQNTTETSGQRYANFPAPYINALRDYQQQNGINSFKRAADQFASTVEGQSLAHGLRAEYEDRLHEYEKTQRGYLTPGQAGELMNVGTAYLVRHGLMTDVPPDDQTSGRVEIFVRPRGVSAETVRRTMDWAHTAFTDPIEAPEQKFYATSEVEKALGCSRRAIIQMTNHGYIPTWRFEAESGATNRKFPQEYVDALGAHLRAHNRLDLIDAAEQFAREHPQAHTLIRGQFELGLHRLAKEGDGAIPREQLGQYLDMKQGQFWRVFGPKPDGRGGKGYPLDYVHDRIAWSGAEIVDRDKATVDARGRVRWQVGSPGIKGQILGEVSAGSVPTDVARQHGIPPRTVLHWVETSRQEAESQRAHQPGITKEQVARAFERRLQQQEVDISAASEDMGAEAARRIIVDSRPTARQFARWVVDNEQSLRRVVASREDINQDQITAQIELARLLSEQHRIFPADVLMCAKVFEDLRPFVQAVPPKPGENPEDRPVMSARQIAAFRHATDLARKGRLAYFPETGV